MDDINDDDLFLDAVDTIVLDVLQQLAEDPRRVRSPAKCVGRREMGETRRQHGVDGLLQLETTGAQRQATPSLAALRPQAVLDRYHAA